MTKTGRCRPFSLINARCLLPLRLLPLPRTLILKRMHPTDAVPLKNAGNIALRLGGASGLSVGVAGVAPVATTAAAVILATAGGLAVVLAGYGAYRYLSERRPRERTPHLPGAL